MIRFKKDRNHQEIVNALRKIGASVIDLANVGKGCPDLLVGYNGQNYLLEIKNNGSMPGSKPTWKFTPDQLQFQLFWRGKFNLIQSVDDVFRLFGVSNV